MQQVTLRKGIVDSLSLHDDIWSVNNGVAFAERVFLVTGSHPRDESPYPDIPVMELDDALIPSKLAGVVHWLSYQSLAHHLLANAAMCHALEITCSCECQMAISLLSSVVAYVLYSAWREQCT